MKDFITKIGPFQFIKLRPVRIKKGINQINKRIFDYLFALLFISFIYWWVYLIVAIVLKLNSKGPIIFKQERVGLNGETFTCYKFRTMHHKPSRDDIITSDNDNRIFAFGSFLRKTNIDEFPQFINIIKGDMSVVGPRPHMLSEDKILSEKLIKYKLRYWTRPGITGLAAIYGYRGGTNNMDLMQKRIDYDIRYIETWSFLLDIKICVWTSLETIFFRGKGK